MENTSDFRKEDNPLFPIQLEVWDGFIFINFDQNAEPLATYLGDFKRAFPQIQL